MGPSLEEIVRPHLPKGMENAFIFSFKLFKWVYMFCLFSEWHDDGLSALLDSMDVIPGNDSESMEIATDSTLTPPDSQIQK